MLHPKLFIVASLLCAVWLAVVFELVRRRKLTEGLSFVWVAASILLTLSVFFSRSFTRIARVFGIQMPENAVLVLGIATLAVATLYLCTRLSDLNRKIVRLSQEVAILNKRQDSVAGNEREGETPKGPAPLLAPAIPDEN